jgi:hypothetical protein
MIHNWGRESSVGIATRYGLDGPGIKSRWEAKFSAPLQTGLGAHTASYTMGTGSFPRVKRLRRGIVHPSPSRAEVKERVNLYLYSPSGPSWSVLEWTLNDTQFYLLLTCPSRKNLLAVICIHPAKSKFSSRGMTNVHKGVSCSLSKNFLGFYRHQILKPTSYLKLCVPAIFLQPEVN